MNKTTVKNNQLIIPDNEKLILHKDQIQNHSQGKKLQGNIAFHKLTKTFMIIIKTEVCNNEILFDCLVKVEEGKEVYFANASYSTKEIDILEITIQELLHYMELQEGKQLSLF